MPKKIGVITDMTFVGSGYYYLMSNLLSGLARMGHEITVAGLGYMGEPHDYPFSIIPCPQAQDGISIINNLIYLQKVDLIMVGMDIPFQTQFFDALRASGKPYIAITPMENGPLVQTWAQSLAYMACVFFISELAKQEALKAGVTKAEHLYVGVDGDLWKPPTYEQRTQLRLGMGIEPDEFVILTVADNQERKNLWAGMRIVAKLKAKYPDQKFKYVMVTKEDSPVGWRLRDLATSEGILAEYLPFQRGLPTRDLWGLYAVANVYLQPSKAEGLGLPVLEAMGCGIPCVTTDTGAMTELLQNERGLLVPPAFTCIDVWGNSKRDYIDMDAAVDKIGRLLDPNNLEELAQMVSRASEYVGSRTWDVPVKQVDAKIAEIFNEQKPQKE